MSIELVVRWRAEVEAHGYLADGIRAMNEALGSKHTNSRVNEWQDGRQKVPKKVARYMLEALLPDLIISHNVSIKVSHQIANEILALLPE